MPTLVANVSAVDFGADPTGTADSTSAINQALAYVASASPAGGVVSLPAGTFKVTPSGTSPAGISFMGTGSAGYQGVRLVGAGFGATILSKQAAGVCVQVSGPSSSPSTGSTHTRYCSLENLQILGNGYTGAAVQCYYVDNFLMQEVFVEGNGDIGMDTAEFWDSRILNCVFGGTGSATANADAPNLYLRNSAASSGFGNSTGTTNDIVVEACRFEAFTTGAVKIAQGLGNSAGVNVVFLTDCKMETSVVNGGSSASQASHLIVDTNSRGVYVKHLYAYSGGFDTGYSTAVDMINFSGQSGTLDGVLLSTGSSATVANGITVNSPTVGETVTVENITGTWTTPPTGALVNYGGTANGTLTVEGFAATGGTLVAGTVPTLSGGLASTVTVANTGGASSLTNLYSQPIPGLQPHVGAVYRMTGYGVFTTTATPTLNWQLYWGGTSIGNIPAYTTPSGASNLPFRFVAEVTFRTATSCTADIAVTYCTATTGATATYLNAPTGPVTVTTATSQNLTAAVQWQTSSTASISLLGGMIEKVY